LKSTLIVGPASGADAGSYRTTAFGANQQAWCDILRLPVTDAPITLALRIVNPNTGSLGGYEIQYWHSGPVIFYVRLDTAAVITGPVSVTPLADGDSFGIEMIGTSLIPYYKHGGVWAPLDAGITSSLFTAGGFIGLRMAGNNDDSAWIDTFGGGDLSRIDGSMLRGLERGLVRGLWRAWRRSPQGWTLLGAAIKGASGQAARAMYYRRMREA
jgi:hypothetical protein